MRKKKPNRGENVGINPVPWTGLCTLLPLTFAVMGCSSGPTRQIPSSAADVMVFQSSISGGAVTSIMCIVCGLIILPFGVVLLWGAVSSFREGRKILDAAGTFLVSALMLFFGIGLPWHGAFSPYSVRMSIDKPRQAVTISTTRVLL